VDICPYAHIRGYDGNYRRLRFAILTLLSRGLARLAAGLARRAPTAKIARARLTGIFSLRDTIAAFFANPRTTLRRVPERLRTAMTTPYTIPANLRRTQCTPFAMR